MNAKSMISGSRRNLLLLALCVPVLADCFGAAAVGVGAAALVLTDRRFSEAYITDQGIEQLLKAKPRLHLHITQQHSDREPSHGTHPH